MHAVDDDRCNQMLLRREAAEDRALADAGAAGDLRDANLEPMLRERVGGGVEKEPPVALGIRP
jgi:hypothetical protein